MKSKNRNIIRKKKEFRYHQVIVNRNKGKSVKIRHPTYIYLEKGNIYVYVSITHSKCINNQVVVKFHKNPNPKDSKESYWIDETKEDKKDSFGKKQKEWRIDPIDDENIRKR